MLNRCEFIGNLGADVEIRTTQSGDKIANLRLAVSERWKDRASGERKERTTWVPVTIFGAVAGIAEQYCRKGSKVFISGAFTVRKWQDQSGQDRYSTEVVLRPYKGELVLLDKGDGSGRGSGQESGHGYDQSPAGYNDLDDEIPF